MRTSWGFSKKESAKERIADIVSRIERGPVVPYDIYEDYHERQARVLREGVERLYDRGREDKGEAKERTCSESEREAPEVNG